MFYLEKSKTYNEINVDKYIIDYHKHAPGICNALVEVDRDRNRNNSNQ